MSKPHWVKPGVWGAVLGAVVMMIVGFAWLGWTLGSTAETMAQERATKAVVAVLTPVCVENFMQQPDATAQLGEFQKIAAWQQHQLVEKGGWATVPGSTTPHAAVARACADQLTRTKT
jgi:hypothetical protein